MKSVAEKKKPVSGTTSLVQLSRSFAINPIPSVQVPAVLVPPHHSSQSSHTCQLSTATTHLLLPRSHVLSHVLPSVQNPIFSSSWLPRRARASCKTQGGLRELLLSDTFFAQVPDLCLLQHSLCWSLTPVCLLPDEPQNGNWVPRSSLRPREMTSCSANNRPNVSVP